jgi:hypothetical protein
MSQTALGIDENNGMSYEGTLSFNGHAIWPAPFFSIASHIGSIATWEKRPNALSLSDAPMLFREDFFDPIARMRRGRLYIRYTGMNPETWRVRPPVGGAGQIQSNMAGPNVLIGPDRNGYVPTRLVTFLSWRAHDEFFKHRRDAILVLGASERASIHTVLDVERLANGEELITLRARASLGVLPRLMEGLIPSSHTALVLEQYEKAANAAFRDDAESIVDRCREAATAALIAERANLEPNASSPGKDLGDLAKFFDLPNEKSGGRLILSSAARIIARLHARGKSAERVNKGLPALTEADAECALALLGTIYRELRWTH